MRPKEDAPPTCTQEEPKATWENLECEKEEAATGESTLLKPYS